MELSLTFHFVEIYLFQTGLAIRFSILDLAVFSVTQISLTLIAVFSGDIAEQKLTVYS
jgi:hypothetical protein